MGNAQNQTVIGSHVGTHPRTHTHIHTYRTERGKQNEQPNQQCVCFKGIKSSPQTDRSFMLTQTLFMHKTDCCRLLSRVVLKPL